MDDMTRCELLKTISEYQFVAVELNLYLDTHPGDAAARSDYLYYSTRLKELIAAYAMFAANGPGIKEEKTKCGSIRKSLNTP